MRPTGALSFQLDWKDLHAAGRPSPPPFLTHGVPFYPVYRISAGPHRWTRSQLTLGSRKRSMGGGGPSPEAEAVAVNSANQGGRYMPWECRRRYPTRWPWARPSGRTRQAWSGRLCDPRVHCSSSDTGGAYTPPGDTHHHVPLPWMRRQWGPRARHYGIQQGNHCLSFREGLEDSVVGRTSSRIPHSVAKDPPEWSHETEFPGGTRSNPDRRGVGA